MDKIPPAYMLFCYFYSTVVQEKYFLHQRPVNESAAAQLQAGRQFYEKATHPC